MEKAKWRGEIKIQQELVTLGGPVARRGKFLVTSHDGTICVEFPSSRGLRRLLNSRAKAYFRATLLGNGKLDIRQEILARDW